MDDFESYDEEKGNRVFDIWLDGWENKTGSQVGYLDIPFTENTIVHGGRQAMPLTYSNAAAPFYAETERTFDEPQDWTLYGIGTLTVYFRGSLDNSGQLYAKINNTKVAYNGDAGDIGKLIWQAWNIDLKTVGGNLKNVSKLMIGVEGANTSGIVYIDDIRLYPKAPESTTSVEPDRANLIAHYTLDGNANDSSANGYHGVAAADADLRFRRARSGDGVRWVRRSRPHRAQGQVEPGDRRLQHHVLGIYRPDAGDPWIDELGPRRGEERYGQQRILRGRGQEPGRCPADRL